MGKHSGTAKGNASVILSNEYGILLLLKHEWGNIHVDQDFNF